MLEMQVLKGAVVLRGRYGHCSSHVLDPQGKILGSSAQSRELLTVLPERGGNTLHSQVWAWVLSFNKT